MATNITSHDHVIASKHDHEASGRSIFWGLATIVLSATLQPSFCGCFTSGKLFQDSLWPHRSSPLMCLIDAGVDIWIVIDKRRRPDAYRASSEHASPTIVAMRLAIFVLGVLPQAIKLFSMRGVLASQVLAAVFLVSLLASLVRTIHLELPNKDIDDFNKRVQEIALFSTPQRREVFAQFTFALYAGGLYFIWRAISNKTFIPVSRDVRNAAEWLSVGMNSVTFIYIQQHLLFTIVRGVGKWVLPRWPIPVLVQIFSTPALLYLLRDPQDRPMKWNLAFALGFHVGLCCYAVALGMQVIARKLLRLPVQATVSEPPPSNLEMTVAGRTFDVSGSTGVVEPTGAVPVDRNLAEAESPPPYEARDNGSAMHEPPPEYDPDNVVTTSAEGHPTDQEDGSTSEDSEDIHWSLKILFGYPIVAAILVLSYAELFDSKTNDEEAHNTAERSERTAGGRSLDSSDTHSDSNVASRIRFVFNKIYKRLLNAFLKLLGRTFIAGVSLFVYSSKWLEQKMKGHPEGTVWIAFGMLNFVTAMVYLLVVFDGAGTYSPPWTSVLG